MSDDDNVLENLKLHDNLNMLSPKKTNSTVNTRHTRSYFLNGTFFPKIYKCHDILPCKTKLYTAL